MQSTHVSQIGSSHEGYGQADLLTNYEVLKSPRFPDGPFSLWNSINWLGGAYRTDQLSSSARVAALALAALELWRANRCRVAAKLSDFLLIAVSLCFFLLPAFLWALASNSRFP